MCHHHSLKAIARSLNRTPRSVQIVCRALFGPSQMRPRLLTDAECERVLRAFQQQGRHYTTRERAAGAQKKFFA